MNANKIWIKKPQNYILIIIIVTIVAIIIGVIIGFYPIIIESLDLIFDIINFITVTFLVAILSLLQIRKLLIDHFNKDKFNIEEFGTLRKNYYYLAVRNKTDEVAKNCRACGVFGDEFEYNLIWEDPIYPREIDIPIEDYLNLFYYKNGKLILPQCSTNPLSFLKESIDNISLKINKSGSNKVKERKNKITKWPYENAECEYEKYKNLTFDVYISASNAKTRKITFTSLENLITKLKSKDPIKKEDKEFITLLKI